MTIISRACVHSSSNSGTNSQQTNNSNQANPGKTSSGILKQSILMTAGMALGTGASMVILDSLFTGKTNRALGLTAGLVGAITSALILGACSTNSKTTVKTESIYAPIAPKIDFTGVPKEKVYEHLQKHFEKYAPEVRNLLNQLKEQKKISAFTEIVGSSAFIIEVPSGNTKEVLAQIEALEHIQGSEVVDV